MAEDFVLPDFLQDGTDVDSIHAKMLAQLPDDIDKTEGGFPWDFTRPTALIASELLQFYIPEFLKLIFPQWSSGQYLDYLASMAQTSRKAASYATAVLTINGTPGVTIGQGIVFATEEANGIPSVEFETTEIVEIGEDGTAQVTVQALNPGTDGNVNVGTIVLMSEPINGITSVTNIEHAKGGTEEESDDDLRERILEIHNESDVSYIGNNADYRRWAMEVDGVGEVIVIPEWDGPGTVKLVCIDANGEAASQTILDAVYEHIMSPDVPSERLAPIGAALTVTAPDVIEVDYSFTIILKEGCSQEMLVEEFKSGIASEYKVAKEDGKLRFSRVFAMITGLENVYDLLDLTVNGSRGNIDLNEGQYLYTNNISITEEKGV